MLGTIRPPSGIQEKAEPSAPITRSPGSTAGEQALAALAERSFLNLWSYPNLYRDQKAFASGEGKELCDLLVVCGEHVIVFSEKTIRWPSGETPIAWSRWARRAIESSMRQMQGAERWIAEHPTRIFLDRGCTRPFPLNLPNASDAKIHRVLLARGAEKACKDYFGVGSGSLMLRPAIKGEAHWNPNAADFTPFSLGDIDPEGPFIHVFDDYSLSVLMKEQDTIRDFTDYLSKREALFRSGQLKEAHGEENLIATYATAINESGEHDFVIEESIGPGLVQRGRYESFIQDPRYLAKKEADKVSYLWDALIDVFTKRMLDGTIISAEGANFKLSENEIAVRCMALASRFFRRILGEAFRDALSKGERQDRFFRAVFDRRDKEPAGTAFFLLTKKYPDEMDEIGGYKRYREERTLLTALYADALLEGNPKLERVIGISREPPNQGRGVSEDLIYLEQHDWSAAAREEIRGHCKSLNILQNLSTETVLNGAEFPEVAEIVVSRSRNTRKMPWMNRKQRRAVKTKVRRHVRH